ncbi:sel1 repeat family protein, partial [Burkholderia cenocepacia]|nr:sel1 repeat family protein [Burkholderia cenocepacia]
MMYPTLRHPARFEVPVRVVALAVLMGITGTVAADQLDDAATAFQATDYATAFALWRPLAEQGNSKAEVGLGKLYDSGFGVPKDPAQATAWFQKAANHGDWTCPCMTGHAVTLRLENLPVGETRAASSISGRCADATRCSDR